VVSPPPATEETEAMGREIESRRGDFFRSVLMKRTNVDVTSKLSTA
jgi:hypothetical protein